MAYRSRTRLRTNSVKWVLVEKPAHCARRIRSADVFRRRNRGRIYVALGSHLVSVAAQAAGQSARFVLRPGVGDSLRAHDNRRVERLAGWRRLV